MFEMSVQEGLYRQLLDHEKVQACLMLTVVVDGKKFFFGGGKETVNGSMSRIPGSRSPWVER